MRLFIALCLPDEAIPPLLAMQARLATGRPVPEENLHLTLAYLGEQPDETVAPLADALETIRAAPIRVDLAEPQVFGGRGGQAVGLLADGGVDLRALHDRVRSRVYGAGVQLERRRFRPHVTLARLRGSLDPGPAVLSLQDQRAGPFTCHAFGLFQSILRPEGAEYDALALYPLSG